MKIKTTIEVEIIIRDNKPPQVVATVDGEMFHNFTVDRKDTLEMGFTFQNAAERVQKMIDAVKE